MLVAIVWLFALGASGQTQPTDDERFLAGLRARQLFSLVDLYCARQLAQEELNDRRRVMLTVEQIRSHAEHAVSVAPAEQRAFWQRAHQTAHDFNEQFPESPRRILVQVQDALVWRTQGELALQQAQVIGNSDALRASASTNLRQAIKRLEQAEQEVDQQLRQAPRGSLPEGSLNQQQLAALSKRISYELARALRGQAQSYPPMSADWVSALTQALERLDDLSQLAVADRVVWKSRLDQVICWRLLQKHHQASLTLEKLRVAQVPADISRQARAERIRLALAAGRLDDAQTLAREPAGRSAELDYARLEVQLAALQAAQQADGVQAVQAWQAEAARQVRQIERNYGPYWMRRAEILLAATVGSGADGHLEALTRAAQSYYRSGHLDQAVATYDRAVAKARAEEDLAAAGELAFTAATIEHDRHRHQAAAARYAALAQQFADHPLAARAHLLAIVNTAALARAAPADLQKKWLAEYERLLVQQTERWSTGPEADRARRWLAELRQARHQWAEAIAVYRQVPSDGRQFAEAVTAAGACYAELLREHQAQGKPVAKIAADAVEMLDRAIVGSERRWPQRFQPFQQQAAQMSAKLRLQYLPDTAVDAEQLLRQAITRSPDAPVAWQTEMQMLLVYALASQGRRADAMATMDKISGGSANGLLAMLEALEQLTEKTASTARPELAALQLAAIGHLAPRREQLTLERRRTLDTLEAGALAGARQYDQALVRYEQLAKQFPNDGQIAEARLRLLGRSTDRAVLEKTATAWRQVERRSRRASPRWFRARYAQAEVAYRLGQADRAAKLIRLTATLHPELGGPEMKARFQRLLERCSK